MTEIMEQIKVKEIEQGKEKRNVPELRFKGFEDEWEEKKIEDVSDVIMGQSPSSEYYNEEMIGMPLIQGNADIKDRITSPRMYTTSITKTCNIGDIIMSVRAPVGSIAKSMHIACIGRGVCSIVPKINNEYLYQILLIQENRWCKLSQGSTFDSINRSDIGRLKIYIPCLNEQIKIAKFLGIIDKKIEKQGEKVEALKTYKKGIMQKIFKQEIRFKDENGGEYPKWEEKRLGEILRERKLYCKKGLDYPHVTLSKDGIYDKSERYDRDFLVKNDNKDYKVTLKNDICYNPANLKFGVICRNKYGSAIFSPIYVTFEIINCNSIFIEHLVTRSNFINKVRKYEEGTVYERMSVKPENLLKFNIKIPDLSEQTKIANFFSTINEKMDKEEKKLEELKVLKKGLLQKMFI